MDINTSQLLDAVATLADMQSMRVSLKGSTKGAIVAGSGTFLGGMLAGPIGLLIGGTLGVVAAYAMSNDFNSVSHIIKHELSVHEQERLKERILGALAEFGLRDLVVILPLLMGNAVVQQAVMSTVISFLTKDMRMQISD